MEKEAKKGAAHEGGGVAAESASGQRDEARQRQPYAEREEGKGQLSGRKAGHGAQHGRQRERHGAPPLDRDAPRTGGEGIFGDGGKYMAEHGATVEPDQAGGGERGQSDRQ